MTQLKLKDIQDGMINIQYKGVPCYKFPFDYVLYQMIINDVRPDLIIEIGTLFGGSALYLADLQETLGIEGGEVHTIDLHIPHSIQPDRVAGVRVSEQLKDHPRIKQFNQGYENYDLLNTEGFKTIMVIDDGSHRYDDVATALRKFSPIVTVGSYYIIEDSNAEEVCEKSTFENLNGGPLRAIREFTSSTNDYIIDLKYCDMFGINSTYNTYGYLKKVQ